MKAARILLASVTGTAFMSLFSYYISKKTRNRYESPVVLSALLSNSEVLNKVNKKSAYRLGWLLHYLAGLSFSVIYDRVWRKTKARPGIQDGLFFGGINGLVGILIWKSLIDNNSNPPKMEYRGYYSHLLAAHFVFGAFTAIGYTLPSLMRKKPVQVLEIRPRALRKKESDEAGKETHSYPEEVNAAHR